MHNADNIVKFEFNQTVVVQIICLDISKEMEKKSFILRQG